MSKQIIGVLFALLMTGCASTHPGRMAHTQSEESKISLKVSAEKIKEGDSKALQLFEITLENTSEAWVKIHSAKVLIGSGDEQKISVVMGEDLNAWAQAVAFKEKVDSHNRTLAQAGLIGAGSVIAAAGSGSRSTDMTLAGTVMAASGYAWVAGDVISSGLNQAQQSEKVPNNHLYHSALIPPQMFIRRWVLLNKPPKESIKTLAIEFETVEGEKEVYAVSI